MTQIPAKRRAEPDCSAIATFAMANWMHSAVRLAPDLFEPLGPAAAPFVVLVSDRILGVVILVVVLGRGEGRGRPDLCRHGLFEAVGDLLLGLLGERLFRVVAHEDDALIGAALVAELAVRVERIDIPPVMVKQ